MHIICIVHLLLRATPNDIDFAIENRCILSVTGVVLVLRQKYCNN